MTSRPQSVTDVQDAVRSTAHIRVRAGGTKSGEADAVLDVGALAGIVEYSPQECVFTARAGTSIGELENALRAHRQYMPFDPPFAEDGATIGGTIAAGVSGPRRYRYGGVRDFLIGVQIVDGEGRVIRSGGKVVKNAAGFLLHHGMVGSCGTFGILTEVTFKVFPSPEARRAVEVACGSVDAAFATARRIEEMRCDCESIDFDEQGHLVVSIAGRQEAIEARVDRLAAALNILNQTCPLKVGQSHMARPLAGSIVKVAAPMRSWQKLRPHVTNARFMCAGAVAWLATSDLPALTAALADARLAGQVIRGAHAGERVGHVPHNEFEERVRRVLDPHDRFRAAPHSR